MDNTISRMLSIQDCVEFEIISFKLINTMRNYGELISIAQKNEITIRNDIFMGYDFFEAKKFLFFQGVMYERKFFELIKTYINKNFKNIKIQNLKKLIEILKNSEYYNKVFNMDEIETNLSDLNKKEIMNKVSKKYNNYNSLFLSNAIHFGYGSNAKISKPLNELLKTIEVYGNENKKINGNHFCAWKNDINQLLKIIYSIETDIYDNKLIFIDLFSNISYTCSLLGKFQEELSNIKKI